MSVKIEERGDRVVFVGECHDKPCATVQVEGIKIISWHSSDKCENIITWEEIERAKETIKV